MYSLFSIYVELNGAELGHMTNGRIPFNMDDGTHISELPGNRHHNSLHDGNLATGDDFMRYNITDPHRPPSEYIKN